MKNLKFGSVIGILGGGQLGKMSAIAAANLGYKVHIFTDSDNSPASHVSWKTTVSDYNDKESLKNFLSSIDVATFEFENIPYETLKFIENNIVLRPSSNILFITGNRLKEKEFLNNIGISTTSYYSVTDSDSLEEAYSKIASDNCILKSAEMGYDGKNQFAISSLTNLKDLWKKSCLEKAILEEKIDFICEISVTIARNVNGNTEIYIPVKNVHENSILMETTAPANISEEIKEKAMQLSNTIVNELDLIGVLTVEMFLCKDNTILVNELAPRPHNSGHWTIDACITDQFEQHIRAICGLELGSPVHHSKAVTSNLLGEDINRALDIIHEKDTKIYIYGKDVIKTNRKMGHITKISKV